MWYIGQTVLRVHDNIPVIYLGIDINYTENSAQTKFKEIDGDNYFEEGGVPEWYPHKYIEIRDNDGRVVLGQDHPIGDFF